MRATGGGRTGRLAGALSGAVLVLALSACGRADKIEDAADEPAAASAAPAAERLPDSPTLAAIRRRGRLNCGVHEGLIGFAYTDNKGGWRGFDVDFCRALAAAILGDADAVRFIPLNNAQRFEALRSGRVDVLWRATSWTLTREATERVRFAGVNYYDGQGFLVRRSLNLNTAAELNGARICVQASSTSELNLADYFRARGLEYQPVVLTNEEAARRAYADERCDAFTADVSALAAARVMLPSPEQHVILQDVISKEPLGPVVKAGDESWTSVVRWTLNALVLAEELGVTAQNVRAQSREARDPGARRLLGLEGDAGPSLGLSRTWARDAVAAGGNYGEIFARNLGPDSALDLERGLNAQWNARPGGLIYALPIR